MRIEDTTILITDDSILARKQLKDIISTLGTPVFVEATDGQSAIDKYKEVHPDLVFLDIVMPKKDGNDAIRDIMEFDPEATIIIASSVGTQSQLKNALEAGAKDFIQKPLDKELCLLSLSASWKGDNRYVYTIFWKLSACQRICYP